MSFGLTTTTYFVDILTISFAVANSPGGVAYGRELQSPDWVLDYWSPEEKAQYPEYFARREQRKKEYVAYWEQKFGVKAEEPHHHH